MRLLTKNEITKIRTDERKLEIDEGMKLANKVDTLRRTVLEEEAKITKFRDENIKQLREEITDGVEEKGELLAEIEALKAQKAILLEPLDAKWEKVEEQERLLIELQESLNEQSLNIGYLQSETEKQLTEANLDRERAAEQRSLAEKELLAAQIDHENSEAVFGLAEAEKDQLVKEYENKFSALVARENELAAKERDIAATEELLATRQRNLNALEAQINDRYQTLLRTEEEINGKR